MHCFETTYERNQIAEAIATYVGRVAYEGLTESYWEMQNDDFEAACLLSTYTDFHRLHLQFSEIGKSGMVQVVFNEQYATPLSMVEDWDYSVSVADQVLRGALTKGEPDWIQDHLLYSA